MLPTESATGSSLCGFQIMLAFVHDGAPLSYHSHYHINTDSSDERGDEDGDGA